MRGVVITAVLFGAFLLPSVVNASGYLRIICVPGVGIYVDGSFMGTTEVDNKGLLIDELSDGTHTVKAIKKNCKPQVQKVEIRSGKVTELKLRFVKCKKKNAVEVKQPDTNLYWLRCPIGQSWTGSYCEGDARGMSWHNAGNACPGGYRLPTREEFVSLLGGCDAGARSGKKEGRCKSCEASKTCLSMFGRDDGDYWSSSSDVAAPSDAWTVVFSSGDMGYDKKEKDNDINVRCVRSGP